jgi:hypothetical protein
MHPLLLWLQNLTDDSTERQAFVTCKTFIYVPGPQRTEVHVPGAQRVEVYTPGSQRVEVKP